MAKYPSYYVRPDGLHETIIRVNGKRKAFRGKTDREVWEKVKAFDRSQAAKQPEKTTFAQVADAWWSEIEPTLAHNTTKGYRPALRRAIGEWGTTAVAEITAKDIDRYVKDFSVGRARKTVTTQLQVIRQILRKAQLEGAIQYNPAEAVRPPKGLPQQRREAPDREQIQKIKDGVGLPFGLFAALVYYTGCRRGEALALKGEDIDRKNRVIHIRRSVYYVGNFPHVKDPKTEKGIRTVPLLSALDELLPARLPSGFLFPGEKGVVIAYASVYGGTENAANILACRLREQGAAVQLFDVSVTSPDHILAAAFRFSHLVLAAPTYNAGVFVTMERLLHELAAHGLKKRRVVYIENGTWAPTSARGMEKLLEPLQWEQAAPTLSLRSVLQPQQVEQLEQTAALLAAEVTG